MLQWKLFEAGLVKWYNVGFPNRGREFDSPIPQIMSPPWRTIVFCEDRKRGALSWENRSPIEHSPQANPIGGTVPVRNVSPIPQKLRNFVPHIFKHNPKCVGDIFAFHKNINETFFKVGDSHFFAIDNYLSRYM